MNIIVTAGGTSERIDNVRSITNCATGRLGSLIAREFLRRLPEKKNKLYYISSANAAVPDKNDSRVQIIPVTGTDELQWQMKKLLTEKQISVAVHSMAVSDYKTCRVTTVKKLAGEIAAKSNSLCEAHLIDAGEIEQSILESGINTETKISSEIEHPVLILEKTPKVINMIKTISPKTVLVGFKLLSGISHEVLIETAYQLLLKNKCDFVLANDTDSMKNGGHEGFLVDEYRNVTALSGKDAIAKGLVSAALEKLGAAK